MEDPAPPSEARPAVKLTIHPGWIEALNADLGSRFRIRNTLVLDAHGAAPLDRYRNPRLGADDALEVRVIENGGQDVLPLPAEVGRRILEYFKSGDPCAPFDCNGFVHFVHEVPFKYCDFDFSRWRLRPYRGDDRVPAGRAVLLGEGDRGGGKKGALTFRSSTHLAIHLGRGLYLSKFGTESGLMVTDLEQMRRGFGGNAVWALEKIR